MMSRHRIGLYRYPAKAHVLGVCAGLAERLEIDVNILRAATFFGIVFSGMIPGLVIYTVIGLVLPPRSRVLGRDVPDAEWDEADMFNMKVSVTNTKTLAQQREEKRAAREEARRARRSAKAERKAAKSGKVRPMTEEENKAIYSSLKRRFSEMETRTTAMEREITSSRFKLERELKSLEEV